MLLSWQPAQHPICCNSLIIPCSFHATFHTCFYGRKMPAPCTVYCFVLSACILFYQAVTTIKRGHLILFLARTTSEHFPVVTGLGCCHFKGVFTPVRGLHTHTHTLLPIKGEDFTPSPVTGLLSSQETDPWTSSVRQSPQRPLQALPRTAHIQRVIPPSYSGYTGAGSPTKLTFSKFLSQLYVNLSLQKLTQNRS